MAAGSTYTPIATTTASGSQSSITLSSIPSIYTDLVIVINGGIATDDNTDIRFNGDTSTNYSYTVLRGNGTSATSDRGTSVSAIRADSQSYLTTTNNAETMIISIQNYSNTTTYKTCLIRSNNAGIGTAATVGLWRSTSAINSITFKSASSYNFNSTTTLTLYGIAAA